MKQKIVVASFQYETCAFSSTYPTEADFEYFKGEDIFRKLVVKQPLEEAGFEVVPSVYANALPGGTMPLALFEKYEGEILETVRRHRDACAYYFYFHGSMEVAQIGSGERRLLQRLREIVGKNPLVALSLDLHANVTDELVQLADIICGYKTAPHTDQRETQLRSVELLTRHLLAGTRPVSAVVGLPMLPPGDAMLTDREPLKGLIAETRRIEESGEADAANLFFGHMWIDAPNTRASVVVTAKDETCARKTALALGQKFWNTRRDYRLGVENGSLETGVETALTATENRVFLSDSGDNTTAGAAGDRLDIAERFLERMGECGKRVCIAGVTDPGIVSKCGNLAVGSVLPLKIGKKEYSAKLSAKGKILGWAKELIGDSATLTVGNVDLIFTEKRSAFISKENFDCADADLLSYRIVVVKLGYLFSDLVPYCDRHYFALTDGGSCVDMRRHSYSKLTRPMFPLDGQAEFSERE